ncbi:P-loop containing nucleoside triphosphate hydrolase protein [Phlegmacium glaucopus]|nr:P-loop containing nucleoside triphosphate hydrolase protein [Phlegmacium glaucopus]
MSRTNEAHAEFLAKEKTDDVPIQTQPEPPLSFESLGLGAPFIQALHKAFPRVKTPTDIQAQLIPAILGTQDILLKDVTGSGKSFGLVLGLINKPRLVSRVWKDGKEVEMRHITTLLLVPHRDLAFQLYRWIEHITKRLPKTRIASIAYVLVRGTGIPIDKQIKKLEENPPHILICTPKALMDVYERNRGALGLNTLSTIAVDEVDYLVETAARKDPNKSYRLAYEKAKRKVARHPGPTRQLLDAVYSKRKEWNERRYSSERSEWEGEGVVGKEWKKTPQLILSSATLRAHLKNYLFEESGWLNKDNLVKIFRDQYDQGRKKKEVKKSAAGHSGKQGSVLHSVLVVPEEGETRNVIGARVGPEIKWTNGEQIEETEVEADECYDEDYEKTPSPFNSNVFETIATGFAFDVPRLALLVIPSSAPVNRAVYELRRLGVNAHGLNLKDEVNILDKATMLVGTIATTRGVDLDGLTHVFIVGIPEGPQVTGKSVDAYVHLAGRVGRLNGREGRVITVVCTDLEGDKMVRILRPTRPVLFPYFK